MFLYRPHLVVYLDVPVDKTMENIKKRNRDLEVNGKALTREFLQYIEDGYKNVYLREARYFNALNEKFSQQFQMFQSWIWFSFFSFHSLVLHYNWVEGGDSEIVVEDIERLDFEKYLEDDVEDLKLVDWRKEEYQMDEDRLT